MKTLYLRNVPDDVVERLERLAELAKTSVSAVAVRELTELLAAPTIRRFLGTCPISASTRPN